eukprot:3679431-Karenia_brevis.AAC.1
MAEAAARQPSPAIAAAPQAPIPQMVAANGGLSLAGDACLLAVLTGWQCPAPHQTTLLALGALGASHALCPLL